MVRAKSEQLVEFKCIRGGNGDTEVRDIVPGEAKLNGKGRLFAHMILEPGHSIGEHVHTGESEIFYFLSGTGEYNDNGTVVAVHAGDTAVCSDGQKHSLKNTGSEPLDYIALILYA